MIFNFGPTHTGFMVISIVFFFLLFYKDENSRWNVAWCLRGTLLNKSNQTCWNHASNTLTRYVIIIIMKIYTIVIRIRINARLSVIK